MTENVFANFYEQMLRADGFSAAHQQTMGFKVWHGGDITRRFLIHQNNRLTGLIEHLAETFPVVKALVGDAFFSGIATQYLQQLKINPPILNVMGDCFASFIDQFEHAKDLPYLADVARIEFARVRAFHAADVAAIDLNVLTDRIAAISHCGTEVELSSLRIRFHPSVSVTQSVFAAPSIWAAHQLDEAEQARALELIDWNKPESCLVFRQGFEPKLMQLPWVDVWLVSKMMLGCSLQDALVELEQNNVDGLDVFDFSQWIVMLVRHELITDVSILLGDK
jgi:hypothetical protein